MNRRLVACVFGLLLIAVFGSLEASSPKRNVGLTVTGQTGCWDVDGNSIPCAGTGQDGEYQMGWTTGTYSRFKDNGDGTVNDNLTGLIWLKNANCFGLQDWATALSSANGLASGACDLTDGSVAGTWRLPNRRELESLIDFSNSFPALPTSHPFSGVRFGIAYWSSTTRAYNPNYAWLVHIGSGDVYGDYKGIEYFVWPVRGGH